MAGLMDLQKQLSGVIPNARDQLRMVAIGAILNAKLVNGKDIVAADIAKEADDIAVDLLDAIDKL